MKIENTVALVTGAPGVPPQVLPLGIKPPVIPLFVLLLNAMVAIPAWKSSQTEELRSCFKVSGRPGTIGRSAHEAGALNVDRSPRPSLLA